jgi:hypothetical protein
VIDVAILGVAARDAVIYSHTACVGDVIIIAIDLHGRIHPSCALNWDSVTMKSSELVRAQVDVLGQLAREHLVTAGKDISNPGIIGTLGMLLEVSGKGALIDLDLIPKPDLKSHAMTFEQWIRCYPGMGFVLTARPEYVKEIARKFSGVGMTAQVIGIVDASRELRISYDGEDASVFDISRNGVMYLFSDTTSCQ